MITKGNKLTEKEYRQIEMNSSSSVKDFATDRMKYYKKYILGEEMEEEDSSRSMLIGNIVDCLLLSAEDFDRRFFMSNCVDAPGGNMLNFVNALVKYTKLARDESGMVTRTFEDICKDAYGESGYKPFKSNGAVNFPLSRVLENFKGKDAELYYKEKRDSNGKQVVCMSDMDNANRIVDELKNNEFTRDIINKINDGDGETVKQLKMFDHEIDGVMLKGMLDLTDINHIEKWLQPIDLKCTWSVENFYNEYYLKRRAYIQAYLYHQFLVMEKDALGYGNYEVRPTRFIVCDSINYYSPLIYQLSQQDLSNAYTGFYERGWYYKGVKETLADLKWAKENNIWKISRQNYENNGVSPLKRQ